MSSITRGKAKVQYIGKQGNITSCDVSDVAFIYTVSATKDPNWEIGDKVELPDGREFRYAYSAGACLTGQGCEFTSTGLVPITTFTVAAAAGAYEISVPAATHDTVTLDSCKGGYVVIYDPTTTNRVQFRGIVGNSAALTGVAFTIRLDGPLDTAITTSSKIEVFDNPYKALRTGTTAALAKAGVPAAYVSAASMYFWVQKVGPSWAAPQSTVGAHDGLGCTWKHDGSLDGLITALGATVPDASSTQYAGHVMIGSASGNGPLFMLQG